MLIRFTASPRRRGDDETFILGVSNEEFHETLKNRRGVKRTSISHLRTSNNLISPPLSMKRRKYVKMHVRLVPQPAGPGYPQRWTYATFNPCPDKEERIDDQPCQYGEALGIFKGGNMVCCVFFLLNMF